MLLACRLCLVLLLLFASAAHAAPKWVRIALPAQGAATAMNIAWNTEATSDPSEVQYGLSPAALGQTATGAAFLAKSSLGAVHEVALTGLQPATTYHYRVGGSTAWSSVHNFHTAPADGCKPFHFIAGGDHRSDDSAGPNPKWKGILEQMTADGPSFILESGDMVHDGDVISQWTNHMDMAALRTAEFPLMTAIGNHDNDSVESDKALYNQIFFYPKNTANQTEDFYYFTYGQVIVVSLSTQTAHADKFAQQAKWLDEVLTAHADMTWRFVFYHHPSHSSYIDLKVADLNHPPDEQGQNAALVPVFDKHHVDVVFAGHNHFYERFAPMKAGQVQSTPANGTIYVTSGGTGAFTYDVIDIGVIKIEPMKVICGEGLFGIGSGKAAGSLFCSGKHHYVRVEIDGNTMNAKVIATQEQNLSSDPKNVQVFDTFQIVKPKPVPDPCATAAVEAGPDAGSAPDAAADAPDATAAADAPAEVLAQIDVATQDDAASDAEPAPDDAQVKDVAEEIAQPPAPDATQSTTDMGGLAGPDQSGTVWVSVTKKSQPTGSCTASPSAGSATPLALLALLVVVYRRKCRWPRVT